MLYDKIQKGEEDIVFVYTICGGMEEARTIGYSAIKEKLAISMDSWVIHSIYPWQNNIQEVDQYILMFSTQKKLSGKLVSHIESEHSYKVPMVAVCSTNMTNIPYSLWVENTLNNDVEYIVDDGVHDQVDISSLNKLK